MNLIFETDIGRDPDDFFALLYMLRAGVNIRCITISPGDNDQVAVVHGILDYLGLNIPVGVGKQNREGKRSSGGVHYKFLNMFNFPLEREADGYGPDIIEDTINQYHDCELFVCGPMNSIGEYFRRHPDSRFNRATVQGGFLPYSANPFPCQKLEKFVGKDSIATFNLNGDVDGAKVFLDAKIANRYFVSKNVCHTVVYDKSIHSRFLDANHNDDDIYKLFGKMISVYLEDHPEKKFHDPCAAVCHLHPEIANWVKGKLEYAGGKWTTNVSNPEDNIIASIDYDLFWKHIVEGD